MTIKYIKIINYGDKMKLLLIIFLVISNSVIVLAADTQCDQKQALEYLTKIGALKMKTIQKYSSDIEKRNDFIKRLSGGGTLIAKKQYNEACAHYEKIISDFGLDISQSKAMSVADINKFNDNADPSCTIKSIMMRSNSNTGKIVQLKSKIPFSKYDELYKSIDEVGQLMRTDLAKACEMTKSYEKILDELISNS
jgi:hypothetical protein